MTDKQLPLIVAHRAGNEPASARDSLTRSDLVELDVHVFRGRVEVRHEKVLWPTARLWERWYLAPKGQRGRDISEILAGVGPDAHLMLDLKCFTRRAARKIRDLVPRGQPLTVSARSWWVLRTFRSHPGASVLRSCGNRAQLRLALRIPGLGETAGLAVHERLLDRSNVRAARSKTPLLYSWAITSVARSEELVAIGVTGLIVDDLDKDWPRAHPHERHHASLLIPHVDDLGRRV